MGKPRGAKPAWASYPILPRDLSGLTIPKAWLAYNEAEDRAYCRVNSLTFHKRVKPLYEGQFHPRHQWKHLPAIPRKFTTLRGQLQAFHVREWQESTEDQRTDSSPEDPP